MTIARSSISAIEDNGASAALKVRVASPALGRIVPQNQARQIRKASHHKEEEQNQPQDFMILLPHSLTFSRMTTHRAKQLG
jgi:hypothetical protein